MVLLYQRGFGFSLADNGGFFDVVGDIFSQLVVVFFRMDDRGCFFRMD